MGIQINKLTNANVYVNGTSRMGRAEEVELPTIKPKMSDHKALGLIGDLEFWSGGIEKMEAKIKWNCFYRDSFLEAANPSNVNRIQLRGSLKSYNAEGLGSEVSYVCFMSGTFKELPLGNFKALDNAEFNSVMTVYSVKLEVAGEELINIDVLSNIYKVAGKDILEKYRINVGS